MTLTRTIKILIWVVVAANILFWLPSTRLSCLYALGRASRCPFQKAVKSYDTIAGRQKIERRLFQERRLVAKDSSYHQWETSMGRYWVPARNDDTLVLNLAEQATKVYGEGRDGVQPGDVVLDCGANVGVFTHEALADGARLVVAIEPAPENVECLRRNFADEIVKGRVIVLPKGVWDHDDSLALRVDAGNSARNSFVGSFGPAMQEVKVPLTTIDELLADQKIDRADFIKLDVEGAEKRALAGARNTLAKFHPRLAIAMEHLDDDPVRIPEVVLAQWSGYRIICGDCIDELTQVRPDVLYFQ
ncbi:MAG: FkbM family methyltransferase [Acidobacteriia bacterium]|nr:FkbM family methyltransferase [Terriglobia bacterium]